MKIEKLISDKSSFINKELEKAFCGDIPNLYDAVWYHLGTGGKRIRPALAIMACEALGGDAKKSAPFAAACEVLHQWLLVHDDIEDSDKVRRNKPAMWVKYGTANAINAGDLMAQKVYELILNSKKYGVDEKTINRLVGIMVETAVKTAEGQAMEMNLRKNNNPKEKEYMEMVTGKTAYYLAVPVVGGAIIAGANNDTIEKIREFGKYAGPVFQITDDLLDLTKGKGRKEIGRDIKEGKRSILVVHCLSRCNSAEKKRLLAILNKAVEKTTKNDVLYAKRLFEKYGSIGYAKNKAAKLANEAKNAANELPKGLKNILDSFADYLVERER